MIKILISCVLIVFAVESSIITWNMQGALHDGESSKWSEVKNMIIKQRIDIIALQEAGSPSLLPNKFENVTLDHRDKVYNPDRFDMHYVHIYKWNLGSKSRPSDDCFVYFLQTDRSDTSRVNLAIVVCSRQTSNIVERIMIMNRTAQLNVERPAFGVKLTTNDYYFNIHANPKTNGFNTAPLIERIYGYLGTQQSVNSWIVVGDFNKEPNDLESKLVNLNNFVKIVSPGIKTHDDGIIDYGVTFKESNAVAAVKRVTLSDHDPVIITM